jgi:multidrug efflux pump subunit AcrA (membrane-fusion protein)
MTSWINKKTFGGILLVLVLLLIFFSKTIYTWYLPEVTAVKPFNGQLSKMEMGYGAAQLAEVESIYIPEEGIAAEMYVKEGQEVKAGDKLFSMKYDREENDWKLQEIENNRDRIQKEIESINIRLEAANYPDAEMLQIQQSAAEAEKYLSGAESLYNIGSISQQELSEARNQVSYLRLKLDNSKREAAETIKSLQLELEGKKLELENLSIMEEPYRKTQLIHNTGIVITAPEDGTLLSLSIAKGEKVEKDQLAAKIGTGNDYILECSIPLENSFIVPGDTCSLSNSSHQAKGVISSLFVSDQGKTARIRFTAEEAAAGETFRVLFQKESEATSVLVPNGAINKDKDGYYLKQVKRRDGIMGKEYYLDRIDIFTGDSDSRNTAVIQGITFFEPVLLSSDKEAGIGDVVLLKNAGDFFEE